MDPVEKQYEADLAIIDHSGPHPIDAERMEFNRQVFKLCRDIIPIDDIHKLSDADLLYRFLIAWRWDVDKTVTALHEYVIWRKENKCNELLWEEMPEEAYFLRPKWQGFDRFGHPVFYDTPDPKKLAEMLQRLPREVLLRGHFAMMEQGRRLQKIHSTDRVSSIINLQNLTLGIVANTKGIGLIKEFSKIDQAMYPENMRTMLICNGGWTFGTIWKIIRPLLDVRVQKKINFVNGSNIAGDIDKWISLDQVPVIYQGTAGEDECVLTAEDWDDDAPVGCAPKILPVKGKTVEGVVLKSATCATTENTGGSEKSNVPPPLTHFEPSSGGKSETPTREHEYKSPTFSAPVGLTSSQIAAGENDEALEFHSLPSTDDERDGSMVSENTEVYNALQQQPSQGSANKRTGIEIHQKSGDASPGTTTTSKALPPPEQPTILSSALSATRAQTITTVEFLLRVATHSASGQRRTDAFINDGSELFACALGNVISDHHEILKAQLLIEAGHPMHTFIIIANDQCQAYFILKKRNFHKEIQIFRPMTAGVAAKKNMKVVCEGERQHVFTVRPRVESKDCRDWQVTLHKDRQGPVQAHKYGDKVQFHDTLLTTPPLILFSLAVAIQELWYFGT